MRSKENELDRTSKVSIPSNRYDGIPLKPQPIYSPSFNDVHNATVRAYYLTITDCSGTLWPWDATRSRYSDSVFLVRYQPVPYDFLTRKAINHRPYSRWAYHRSFFQLRGINDPFFLGLRFHLERVFSCTAIILVHQTPLVIGNQSKEALRKCAGQILSCIKRFRLPLLSKGKKHATTIAAERII